MSAPALLRLRPAVVADVPVIRTLIEGLAEYFMTAEVSEGSVKIGGYNESRVYGLSQATWIPLDDLLTQRVDEARRGSYRDTYYPVAWLLTHWLMSEEPRRAAGWPPVGGKAPGAAGANAAPGAADRP